MDQDDALKKSFITDWGIFTYNKMPSDLKNTDVAYQ